MNTKNTSETSRIKLTKLKQEIQLIENTCLNNEVHRSRVSGKYKRIR